MAIFRLQENMPDVYVRKSRDFQLLCNSFDAVFNSVKNDIDSITNVVDTRLCSERLLPLLQTKLGFFTNKHLTATELRIVLQAFKYIVRDKGSRTGIREAIEVFLKVANASNKSRIQIVDNFVSIDGHTSETRPGNTYIVEVAIEGQQMDTTLLTELLKYVLPAGYQLKYSFYNATQTVTQIHDKDTVHIIFVDKSDNNGIRLTTSNDSDDRYPYELTWVDFESSDESYYYIKENNAYIKLHSIPNDWPNGEYYRAKYIYEYEDNAVEVKEILLPEYEPNKYYRSIGIEDEIVLITTPEAPEDWGSSETTFYYDSDGSEPIEFEAEYRPLVDGVYVPFEENKYYAKTNSGTHELVTGKFVEAGTYYTQTIDTRYYKVVLPYNSINGVGTTTTFKFTSNDIPETSFDNAKKAELPSDESGVDWMKDLEDSE